MRCDCVCLQWPDLKLLHVCLDPAPSSHLPAPAKTHQILSISLSGNSVANVLYHKTGLESLTVVPSTATYTLERLEYTSISKTFLPLAGLRGVSMLGRVSSEKMVNDSKKKKKE